MCVPVLMHFTPPGNTFFAVLFSSLPASLRPYMQQPPCRYHAGRQVHAALARSSHSAAPSALLFPKVDGRDLLPEEDADLDRELGEVFGMQCPPCRLTAVLTCMQDELFTRAVLASEMLAADIEGLEQASLALEEEESTLPRNYALDATSVTLRQQLDALSTWRTEVKGAHWHFDW